MRSFCRLASVRSHLVNGGHRCNPLVGNRIVQKIPFPFDQLWNLLCCFRNRDHAVAANDRFCSELVMTLLSSVSES